MNAVSCRAPTVAIYKNLSPGLSEGFVTAHARSFRQFNFQTVCAHGSRAGANLYPTSLLGTLMRHSSSVVPAIALWSHKFKELPTFDLWHAHFGPDGVSALPCAQAQGVPLVVTFHGFDATLSRRGLLLARSPTKLSYLARRRQLFRSAKLLLCVSDFVRDRLLRLGAPEESTRTLYLGVDTGFFVPSEVLADESIILSVGRLVESKAHDDLIRAMPRILAQHPSAQLWIAGDGPERGNLSKLSVELGIHEKVRFLGATEHSGLQALYRRASVFAFPSRRAASGAEEAFGLVLSEASSAGLPVVAMNLGGISEAVVEGVTGRLVPPGDSAKFADAIVGYLNNREASVAAGMAGRIHCVRKFNVQTQARTLEDFYVGLLAR